MNTPIISAFDEQDRHPTPVPTIRRQAYDQQGNNPDSDPEASKETYIIPGAVFTVVIILLVGFAAIKLTDAETLPIRNVSVAGNFTHLSPSGLQERVSNVVRGGFFSVNVETIQEALLQEPWIQDVSVKRVWPDRITVTIREQTAIAQWGSDGLLNSEAEIFYPDRFTFPVDLPAMTGPKNTNRLVLENFVRIQEILPEGISLRQLSLSERRSWELQLNTGPVIRLGKFGIVTRMQRFLQHLPADGFSSMEQIQYIDMRYTNGFALLKKPENKDGMEVIQENYGEEI